MEHLSARSGTGGYFCNPCSSNKPHTDVLNEPQRARTQLREPSSEKCKIFSWCVSEQHSGDFLFQPSCFVNWVSGVWTLLFHACSVHVDVSLWDVVSHPSDHWRVWFIDLFIWYVFAGPTRLTRLPLTLTKRFPAVVLEIWLPAKSDVWFNNLLKQQHVCLYVTWDW